MLTIQINGKTYIQGPNSIWSMNAIVQSAIDCGGLVELSPEKSEDTLYGRSIVEQIRDHKEQSIITKLRASLENMSLEAGQNSFDGIPNSRNYYDGQEKAYLNCLTILNRLTSLEEEKETEEVDQEQVKENIRVMDEQDGNTQFTPGQMIEVSNDGEKWEKKIFHEKIRLRKPSELGNEWHETLCKHPWHTKALDAELLIECWDFARPLQGMTGRLHGATLPQQIREVIVPEFDADTIEKEAFRENSPENIYCVGAILDKLLLQTEKITQWIHSQSNK